MIIQLEDMVRKFLNLVLLFLSLVLAGCSFPASAHNYSTGVRVADQSSMVVKDALNGRTIGSATLVQKEPMWHLHRSRFAVVTAKHVADYPGLLEACYVNDLDVCVLLPAFTSGFSDGLGDDWAFVELRKRPEGMRAAQVRRTRLTPGEATINIGHPWGQYFVSTGMISHLLRDPESEKPIYVVHSFAAPGNSGGGLFDRHGRFVGIVVAREIQPAVITGMPTEQEDFVYAVPVGNMVW